MIHPSQLTREAGFEDGVVVEIVWRNVSNNERDFGFLHIESDTELWLTHWDDESLGFEDVISIRPLTGPMAIWNFAPEWATCCQSREMGISWEHKIPEWWDGKSTVIQLRPWWCK